MKRKVDNTRRRMEVVDWIRSVAVALLAALFLTQVLVVNA